MGLDIQLFDGDGNEVCFFEIEQAFHNAIFCDTKNWGSYTYLRKINDYYAPNIQWRKEELEGFINDLKNYRIHISKDYLPQLNSLIDRLSDNSIERIHIIGD
ncbi:hypothetical protein [Bacillus sp. AFS031507]|uniref:hypothetical protein n=1 Tax=Bacillus sp. AFS031507 TaxID=2033496 RepID=UPI000BFBA3E9|nr:hypothetical protein [Bacillus sp. AFS031507]PGY07780.1 hypothetical protein COE25_23255 [Bacillus sp. AFS031507]